MFWQCLESKINLFISLKLRTALRPAAWHDKPPVTHSDWTWDTVQIQSNWLHANTSRMLARGSLHTPASTNHYLARMTFLLFYWPPIHSFLHTTEDNLSSNWNVSEASLMTPSTADGVGELYPCFLLHTCHFIFKCVTATVSVLITSKLIQFRWSRLNVSTQTHFLTCQALVIRGSSWFITSWAWFL